jgi:hypothetical protein
MRKVMLLALLGVMLATGALLLLAALGAHETMAQGPTRGINLNTGYDQWVRPHPGPIAVGQKDNEWRVITDPTDPPPTPPAASGRPADVVTDTTWKNYGNGSLTQPDYQNSVWISINPSRYPGPQPPTTDYQYAYYFTLPPEFSSPQLTMHLNADDWITQVTLNSCELFGGGGGVYSQPPLYIGPVTLLSCFNSGADVNVLTVTVQDTGAALTGLIVAGWVTYQDCSRQSIDNISNLESIILWEGDYVC